MRFEHSVLSILAAIAAVQAQDIDNGDVPRQCRSLCDEAVAVSDRCDRQTDGSRAFLDCFCNDAVAQTLPDCEACVNFYDDDDADNDVNDLRTSCGLPTATFDPNAASSTAAPPQPSATTTGGGPSASASSVASSVVNSATSSVNSQMAPSASPTSFTGGAPAATAAPVGAVAAAVFGLAQLL